MSNQEVVKYILDTYPEYIDNLLLIDLKNLLLKDSKIKEGTNIWYSLRTIMQLIVNECGVDIVNDIDLSLYKYDELLLKKELGTQEVLIKIYDNYNNKFEGNTKLTILEDTESPVFSGLKNITLEAGNKYNL